MTRDELILNNLGLVGSCAGRFVSKGVDYDDLYMAGCVGLIKAVDRFDESLGFAFSTYAVPSILGEIRRIFRDGGAVKISRNLKEKARELNKIREDFIKENDIEPTVSELSDIMNISIEEVSQLLCVSMPVISLTTDSENGENELLIPCKDEYEKINNKLSINQIIESLNSDDKKLIELRFYKGLTQSKTASILGISQVQVSRREKTILNGMRKKLTG